MAGFPLFDDYPRLRDRLPRIALGRWPTPVERLSRFGEWAGITNLWVKREDLSHPACGGNKIRGLEFLLADALTGGAKAVLTLGAVGSFHVRATAICARQVGIDTVAILAHQPRAAYVQRNLAAALDAGARLLPTRLPLLPLRYVREMARRDRVSGKRPYIVPPGGTSVLACVGHVNAAFELREQVRAGDLSEPDFIFVPLGSLGTAAGLALGCSLAGLKTRVVGVVVFSRLYCTRGRWARMANRTARFMCGIDTGIPMLTIRASDLLVVRSALGRGYAHFTPGGIEAASRIRAMEDLVLDGTYSAKMYDGALRFLRENAWTGRNVLLWHTFCAGVHSGQDVEVRKLPRALRAYFTRPLQALDSEFRR